MSVAKVQLPQVHFAFESGRTLRRQMDRKRTVTKDPYNPEFKEAFQFLGMVYAYCLWHRRLF